MTPSDAFSRKTRLAGIACAIAVIFLYSGFTLVSKLGFASSLKMIDVAALRFSVAGMVMLPILLSYGLGGLRCRDVMALTFFGGLGFALLAYTGFFLAPASHGGVLLHGTIPLFSFLFARFIHHTRATVGRTVGLSAVFLGIIAMIWDSLHASTPRQMFGDSSLLLASASWSAYGLILQRLKLKPAHSAAIVAVFSMCCFLPVYLMLPYGDLSAASWQEILFQGIFQGVLIGSASIFLYTQAVALLGAVEMSLFSAAVPCLTTVVAVFLLGEVPSAYAIAGVATVTIGMGIAMNSQSATPQKTNGASKPG